MTRIFQAEIHLPESCDPTYPGDCAPTVYMQGAEDIKALTLAHGIAFEELTTETLDQDQDQDELTDAELVEEYQPIRLVCPLEPAKPWDDSVCRRLIRIDEASFNSKVEAARLYTKQRVAEATAEVAEVAAVALAAAEGAKDGQPANSMS